MKIGHVVNTKKVATHAEVDLRWIVKVVQNIIAPSVFFFINWCLIDVMLVEYYAILIVG